MARGGRWLREERRRRGFEHGTTFAETIGIKQVRLSAYERGLYPVPKDVAAKVAKAFDMRELDVWRGLGLDLPADAETDEALDDYYESKYPDVFAAVEKRTGVKVTGSGGKHRRAGVRRKAVTRKSDDEGRSGQDRASGA